MVAATVGRATITGHDVEGKKAGERAYWQLLIIESSTQKIRMLLIE